MGKKEIAKEIERINELIERSKALGNTEVSNVKGLSEATIKKLEKEGYSIIKCDTYTTISWDNIKPNKVEKILSKLKIKMMK